jgi:hypothetical protein
MLGFDGLMNADALPRQNLASLTESNAPWCSLTSDQKTRRLLSKPIAFTNTRLMFDQVGPAVRSPGPNRPTQSLSFYQGAPPILRNRKMPLDLTIGEPGSAIHGAENSGPPGRGFLIQENCKGTIHSIRFPLPRPAFPRRGMSARALPALGPPGRGRETQASGFSRKLFVLWF